MLGAVQQSACLASLQRQPGHRLRCGRTELPCWGGLRSSAGERVRCQLLPRSTAASYGMGAHIRPSGSISLAIVCLCTSSFASSLTSACGANVHQVRKRRHAHASGVSGVSPPAGQGQSNHREGRQVHTLATICCTESLDSANNSTAIDRIKW